MNLKMVMMLNFVIANIITLALWSHYKDYLNINTVIPWQSI
jgi:hypothetical protein